MDEADRRILKVIQKNPDFTMRELGDAAGLSHTPCWRRLQKLREDGVIVDKRYILNPKALGYEICLFCFIRMKEHTHDRLIEFERAVMRIPEVLQCYSITGDFDYLLRVIAKNVKDYEVLMKDSLVTLPHVSFIHTSLTLGEIKNTPDLPV